MSRMSRVSREPNEPVRMIRVVPRTIAQTNPCLFLFFSIIDIMYVIVEGGMLVYGLWFSRNDISVLFSVIFISIAMADLCSSLRDVTKRMYDAVLWDILAVDGTTRRIVLLVLYYGISVMFRFSVSVAAGILYDMTLYFKCNLFTQYGLYMSIFKGIGLIAISLIRCCCRDRL